MFEPFTSHPVAVGTLVVMAAASVYAISTITRTMREVVRRSYIKGYKTGVCEGLVWPHSNTDAVLRDEVDASTARYFVKVLNEAYAADPSAVKLLFNTAVPVSPEMIKHPTIPVAGGNDSLTLSTVGIVNGLLPLARNRYRVASCYANDGGLTGFKAYDMNTGDFLEEPDAPIRANLPAGTSR